MPRPTVNNGGCLGFTWRGRCTSDLDSTCMNCFLCVAAALWDLPQPHRAPYEQQIGSKLFPLPPAQSGGRNNMGACLAGAIKSRPRALFLHPIFLTAAITGEKLWSSQLPTGVTRAPPCRPRPRPALIMSRFASKPLPNNSLASGHRVGRFRIENRAVGCGLDHHR
jgi:hypothetical protein